MSLGFYSRVVEWMGPTQVLDELYMSQCTQISHVNKVSNLSVRFLTSVTTSDLIESYK